jgi:hypothetical protein
MLYGLKIADHEAKEPITMPIGITAGQRSKKVAQHGFDNPSSWHSTSLSRKRRLLGGRLASPASSAQRPGGPSYFANH